MNTLRFKTWRPSASLILLGKTIFSKSDKYNYKLLCLKRSSKSSFMPSTFVFPGGNTSKADCNIEWLKLFEKHGFYFDILKELELSENKTYIYEHGMEEIPKYISLRISAIRETFEECGILICQSNKIIYKPSAKSWATYFGGADIKEWQVRVSEDPSQFLKMCIKFDIYPDLFTLKTWSNWVTPSVYKMRFNTVFFFTAFSHLPPAYGDDTEIQELKWATPDEYIKLNRTEKIELPLPQLYEISKLRRISDIEALLEYAHTRSSYGCEEYFPVRINTSEGLYSILPGDDLYPKKLDENKKEVDFLENLPPTHTKNRVLHTKELSRIIVENFTPKVKHLLPVSDE